jgi:hypothetical protein
MFHYCERTSDGFWGEPFNAVTNLAFIIAALLLAVRFYKLRLSARNAFDVLLLIGLLFAIGIGSFLWHTLATPWSAWADVMPILLFISVYLLTYLIRITAFGWPRVLGGFVLFHLFNTGLQMLLPADTLNGSIFYLPTLVALLMMGLYSRRQEHPEAGGLMFAGGLFILSVLLRTLDFTLCAIWPVGTHFIWHLLNAYLLFGLTGLVMRHIATVRRYPDSAVS